MRETGELHSITRDTNILCPCVFMMSLYSVSESCIASKPINQQLNNDRLRYIMNTWLSESSLNPVKHYILYTNIC